MENEEITPTRSITTGVLACGLLSLLAALFAHLCLERLFHFRDLTVVGSLIAFGAAFFVLFPPGMNVRIAIGDRGIGTRNGQPNGKRYGPGEHWVAWWTDGVVVRDGKILLIDPPIVEDLAGILEVKIDVYATIRIRDILSSLQVDDLIGVLTKDLVSATREFVGPFTDATIGQIKNLMGEYLMLPPRGSPGATRAHQEVRAKLVALVRFGKRRQRALSDSAIDALMDEAGKFRLKVEQYGCVLEEVKVEEIKLPAAVTDARAKRLAYQEELAQNIMAVENLSQMVDRVRTDHPELSAQKALEAAEMLLKLPVKETILSLNSSDLNELGRHLGEGTAKIADAFIKRFGNDKE